MQLSLRKLSDILGREHGQYTKLLDLLSIQRRAMLSHDPESLNELLKYQGTVVLELKALDEARGALMRKLARSFEMSASEPTLTQIAERAGEPFASEYLDYAARLRKVVQEIEKVNRDNSYLLDRSLDHVNGMLRLFASVQISRGADYTRLMHSPPQMEQGALLCETA